MVQVNRLTKTNFVCKMLPALAFLLSWAVSLGGFWQLMLNYQVDPEKQEEGDSGNNEPSIFTTLEKRYFFTHYYIGLFMRPVLLLTGFLHLCTCRACSLTGPYSTTFGVSYFMIEGHIAYTIVQTILDRKDDPDTVRVYLGLSLILTGVIAQAISWVAIMTISHPVQRVQAERDKHKRPNRKEKKTLSPDLARKLVIAFTLLSAVTWLPLASRIHVKFNDHNEIYVLGVFAVGPTLFLLALLHAGCSEWMRVPTHTLSMLYVMLVGTGAFKYYYTYKSGIYHRVMLAASIVNLFFWGIALGFSQFYRGAHPPQD